MSNNKIGNTLENSKEKTTSTEIKEEKKIEEKSEMQQNDSDDSDEFSDVVVIGNDFLRKIRLPREIGLGGFLTKFSCRFGLYSQEPTRKF
ncbi:unnamed protein product [Meloidogyne enterolobii]|uniref:Uncharacterized protein n=1 Tax=Meloidogyne enterolobii TaxID=390850 RepID=A0ACB1A0A8_MELEN